MTDQKVLVPGGLHSTTTAAELRPQAGVSWVLRRMAQSVASMCPGWLTWWDSEAQVWRARRTGGFLETAGSDRVYGLHAYTVPELIAVIDQQAALDIAIMHADWQISRRDLSGIWHAEGPAVLEAWTAAALLEAIRAAVRCSPVAQQPEAP